VRILEHLSYEEASTLPCAGVTAWNAFHGPVPLKGGDSVLVQGTGGVSIFALQFASALGASVIVTSSSDDKLKLASKLGGQYLINYTEQPDWEKEVLKFTNNRGVDHVIDVGGVGTLMKSVDAVRFAGWIHNIGFLSASVRLHIRRVLIRGCSHTLRILKFVDSLRNSRTRVPRTVAFLLVPVHSKP